MKELVLRHYIAIRGRGLINNNTSLDEFREKLKEEIQEFWDADCNEEVIDGDMAQEAMDIVGVIFNMLHHNGYDVKSEFKYNVEYQESRVINIVSKEYND